MTISARADALVVIDMQRSFVTGPHAVPGAPGLLHAVDSLLARARAAGVLVVHLQNDGAPGSPDEAGKPGWELHFEPRDGEHLVRKAEDDPFVATNLEDLLRRNDASSLALGGLQSEMCVAAAARGALKRGFSVILPHDAHASYPIPQQGRRAPAVPAEHVSRVAEWSLGDEVILVETAENVRFG